MVIVAPNLLDLAPYEPPIPCGTKAKVPVWYLWQ